MHVFAPAKTCRHAGNLGDKVWMLLIVKIRIVKNSHKTRLFLGSLALGHAGSIELNTNVGAENTKKSIIFIFN